MENVLFQESFQLNGTKSHESLDNIATEISNCFEKEFEETDSVYIFQMSNTCKITTFGYAKHEKDDFIIV
jgi:CRISPR-associated protein Cas2